MEEKLKKKRRRRIALVVVAILIIAAVIAGLNFEYADYGEVLDKEVSKAEDLIKTADIGNEKGQHAKYTVLDFQAKLDKAKKTSEDNKAEYDRQKAAYETLKADINNFKESTNQDVLSIDEVKVLAKDKKIKTLEVALNDSDTLTWNVNGKNINKPTAINFMAKLEGPYNSSINEYMESLKLQGSTISFYQNGSFGGKVSATMPIYSKKNTTGYVYKYDNKKGTLTYYAEANIKIVKDRDKGSEDATATFEISKGGDYVVLLKKVKNSDGVVKKIIDKEDVDEAEKDSGNKSTNNGTNRDSNNNSDNGSDTEETDNKISVSITVVNKTFSSHRSNIIPKMTYKCDPGSTVYDVLYTVCRNKNVQIESEYNPGYGAYYIKAIDSLYEFDAGSKSGWMYKVNGAFPNYGCSTYILKGGENIVFTYTCNLGADIGNNNID